MRLSRSSAGLTALLLILGLSASWAQNASEPPASVGKLEYRIEIGRHERLIRTRRSEGVTLAPFASDGCSGGVSAGWELATSVLPEIAKYHGNRPPFESCCITHDRLYHAGGPSDADARTSFEARRIADEQLRQCVMQVSEERMQALMVEYGLSRDAVSLLYRSIAAVIYRAVRVGGAPCTGLPWRWGFGWPACE